MRIFRLYDQDTTQGNPAQLGATKFEVLRERLRGWLGRTLNRFGVPGFIQEVNFYDDLTGQMISVRKSRYFTVISVGDRDYYFKRLTGRFDGTGYQIRCR